MEQQLPSRSSQHGGKLTRLIVCAVAIHVVFCVYAMTQEFLTAHSFGGKLFGFPMFLMAMNRTVGALFSVCAVKAQGLDIFDPRLKHTLLPALTNIVGTIPQYHTLLLVYFPLQSLLKSFKVLPVMLCGKLVGNRGSYSALDYIEGFTITTLVGFLVWDFQNSGGTVPHMNESGHAVSAFALAIGMMGIYVWMDALTCNLEDKVYQHTHIEASQLMLGIEVFSGTVAWIVLICQGGAGQAWSFLLEHSEAWQFVGLLALSSAFGTYACALTLRFFGPLVLSLLMVSRQVVSLILSMAVFQHKLDWLCFLILAATSVLILNAALRHVGLTPPAKVR